MNKMVKIGLVVPVLNNYSGCVQMIDSIVTKQHLRIFVEPQYERNLTEWPLSRAWNNGIRRATEWGAEYILVVNDDIVFSPYTVDSLWNLLSISDAKVVLATGVNLRDQQSPHSIKEIKPQINSIIGDNPDYSCFMVRNDFLELHGLFDHNFKPAYHEDIDSHRRLKLLGLEGVSTTAAPFYHYGSVTQQSRSEGVCNSASFMAGKNYFLMKWGSYTTDINQGHKTPFNNPAMTPKDW